MSPGTAAGNAVRLCLTGGWFESTNVGDNAILAGLCDSIRSRSEAEFVVFTSSPHIVIKNHGLPALSPRRSPRAILRALWGSDALVFTGGTPFYDGLKHMAYLSALTLAARLKGVPVIVFGIALRTLNNPACRVFARFICRSTSYLSAREERTRVRMDELTGQPGRARLLPDPGTQLAPAGPAWADAELKSLHRSGRGPRVAICLRDLGAPASFRASHYGRSFSRREIDRLLSSIAGLCSLLVIKHRARIVFLPMHTLPPDDDRVPALECIRRIEEPRVRERVRAAERQYGPREMKALVGAMDLVVGMRTHSLILSASMGVPNYGLAYALKSRAIMEFFGREKSVQDAGELDFARLNRDVESLLASLPRQRADLARRNRKINEQYAGELGAVLRLAQKKRRKRTL